MVSLLMSGAVVADSAVMGFAVVVGSVVAVHFVAVGHTVDTAARAVTGGREGAIATVSTLPLPMCCTARMGTANAAGCGARPCVPAAGTGGVATAAACGITIDGIPMSRLAVRQPGSDECEGLALPALLLLHGCFGQERARRTGMTRRDFVIRRWSEIADQERLVEALRAIFFEASHTKSFASGEDRRSFRYRWLGRYLDARPDLAHVLFVGGRESAHTLAGYVIGAHEDPAQTDRYDDIGYFPVLAEVTRLYPAHLHINLRHDMRGRGFGSSLIDTFAADVAAAGLSGVHVVTGAGLRNVSFYERNGFSFTHPFAWRGKALVFLGRRVCRADHGWG
jgi:GNAT superfamily N-acetyltransferase